MAFWDTRAKFRSQGGTSVSCLSDPANSSSEMNGKVGFSRLQVFGEEGGVPGVVHCVALYILRR